jgi:Mg2+-importing ATPase
MAPARAIEDESGLDVGSAAALAGGLVLDRLRTGEQGLSATEAARRLARCGLNVVASHRPRPWLVLGRQLRSPLLGLLLAAAVASFFVGGRSDAVIIGVIVVLSVGLGFANEYRAEKAAQALHSRIRHTALVRRAGHQV